MISSNNNYPLSRIIIILIVIVTLFNFTGSLGTIAYCNWSSNIILYVISMIINGYWGMKIKSYKPSIIVMRFRLVYTGDVDVWDCGAQFSWGGYNNVVGKKLI